MRQDYIHETTDRHTEHGHPGHGPGLRVTDAAYRPGNSVYPAHIDVELTVDRDRNAANTARMNAAHESLDGGAVHIDTSIDRVATKHLQERSGTTARIADGGYAIGITVNIAAASGGQPALTAGQEAQLPDLVDAIGSCLPSSEQRNTQALALLAAQQIPTRSDVVEAFDRITLTEIIAHHEQQMEEYARDLLPRDADVLREVASVQPALQAFSAVRLAQLSFPQHPSAALQPPLNTTDVTVPRTASVHRSGPSIDR